MVVYTSEWIRRTIILDARNGGEFEVIAILSSCKTAVNLARQPEQSAAGDLGDGRTIPEFLVLVSATGKTARI